MKIHPIIRERFALLKASLYLLVFGAWRGERLLTAEDNTGAIIIICCVVFVFFLYSYVLIIIFVLLLLFLLFFLLIHYPFVNPSLLLVCRAMD